MKLISLNVEQNRRYDTVLPFLRKENADVICLQEVLKEDLEMYGEKLNKEYFFKPVGKGSVGYDHDKEIGTAIFANSFKERRSEYYFGSEDSLQKLQKAVNPLEERNNTFHPVLICEVVITGESYNIATTHFTWTPKGISTSYQLEDVEKLLSILKPYSDLVLCGDFNAPRGRETWARIAAQYKDNIPEEYKTSLDQKLHRQPGLQNMVDGLFTTASYRAENVRLVHDVSDHMAVVADIIKL